ncbi:MAG: hypothetical protein KGI89_15805 [Euryarchaeota archaeon]|nr:hypothetical protein [Euryarchaeota archaeon]
MVAVSGALIFIGYQLTVYGWSQLQHGNAGFFDILWPGRYKGLMPDPPAPTSTTKLNANPTINKQLQKVPKLPGTVP